MEKQESIQLPEIKTDKLLGLLDTLKWEDHYEFEYDGVEFLLIVTDAEELREAEKEGTLDEYGEPVEFSASDSVDGFNIYLHDTIPIEKRKRILFHEILEATLARKGFPLDKIHEIASKEENKVFGQQKK